MKFKSLLIVLAVFCGICIIHMAAAARRVQGQERERSRHLPTKEVYTGTVVAIGGQFGGASRPFTLEITGYTPKEEAQRAFEILRTQGQDDFMKAISNNKLGFFSLEGQVGRDLNFVQESETEKGRKITILFERWLRMFEVRYGTRSRDYPFTYIELFVDDNGKGEGSVVGLAKVSTDKKNPNGLDIENFGTYAAKLMGVELRTR
jgi:hypothetical protein